VGSPPPVEHRADALFVLPRLPRRVALYGDPPGWRNDLRERGVELVDDPAAADAVVATEERLGEALASGAAAVVVEGSRKVADDLREAGLSARRLLSLPVAGTPALFVDLDRRRAARYGIERGLVHPELWRTARNRVVARLVGLGVPVPFPALVTVAVRAPGPPALLAAARDLGLADGADWVMLVSPGSIVRRNAFLVFPRGSGVPEHALKFARVPGMTVPFEREERGVAVVGSVGGPVAARAPRYLGRVEVDGWHAAAETAAVGTRLSAHLRRPLPRAAKLRAVEAVVAWLVQVARETAGPPESLADELARLEREVLPFWAARGVDQNLVSELPPVPGSFQHNDLAEENVVVRRGDFTVLDWEWAQRHGLPLGDLLYFAVHVLRLVDGALRDDERERHLTELVTGRAPSSPVLFRWVRTLAETLALRADAVGPLALLSWLARAKLSREERDRAEAASGAGLEPAFAERVADLWLSEPSLGRDWPALLGS
jgi:hypothetical protein